MAYVNELICRVKSEKNIRGKIRVGLLGLGKTNLEVLRHLSDPDVSVTLRDTRDNAKIPHGITFERTYFGESAFLEIDEDILFIAPSIQRHHPALIRAYEGGTLLTSDCEEFFSSATVPIYAVTGSDGKSTVTTLTSLILSASGTYAPAIGNIGTPFIAAPCAPAYVTELSSFNLEYLTPRSTAAAITNVTPNHLNFHGSFESYRQAKLNILKNADRTVLSYDDKECRRIIYENGADAVFSTQLGFKELMALTDARNVYTVEDGALAINGCGIVPISKLQRREDYNLKNMLTAIALCGENIKGDVLVAVLSDFSGLAHRCEKIFSFMGVDFYNSSIDTSPTRCASTLRALDRRVHVILGGRGKGLAPDILKAPLLRYAERIALYGEEGLILDGWLACDPDLSRIERAYFTRFADAVEYATDRLTTGVAVLLSPAATAYGEFASFEERGLRFVELIKAKFSGKCHEI